MSLLSVAAFGDYSPQACSAAAILLDPYCAPADLRSAIGVLSASVLSHLGELVDPKSRVLIIGNGIDFDEFCYPIAIALNEAVQDLHIRCYWPETIHNATVDGGDITSIVQDYLEGQAQRYDLAIIATSIIPSATFVRAFIERLESYELADELVVATGIISASAADHIDAVYPSASVVAVGSMVGSRARPPTLPYDGLISKLARNRRYFRHMPPTIEAVIRGEVADLKAGFPRDGYMI